MNNIANIALNRYVYYAGLLLIYACIGAAVIYSYVYLTLPEIPLKQESGAVVKWPDQIFKTIPIDGSIFKKQKQEIPITNTGPLAKRFRLAGTFFAVGANQQARKAIVDDLQISRQQLVSEGEMLDKAVRVVSVFPNYIILRQGTHDEKLWLSFSTVDKLYEKKGQAGDKDHVIAAAAMLNRLGNRIGENRWVLRRNALMGQYQELLNDTERLTAVFESLKPLYSGESIRGYVLDIEGEQDMFNAFGLKQDDIIRKVNSMSMTSRFRAEYFIREFVEDRANAFVLDIERGGKPKKLIYLVR